MRKTGSLRALALPAVLAGGLLLFGSGVASAASSGTYMIGDEMISARGGDFNANQDFDGTLHFMVKSGTTTIQVGDNKESITLKAGDEVVLAPNSSGYMLSIDLSVVNGQAMVSRHLPGFDEDGVVAVISAGTQARLGFSTGTDTPENYASSAQPDTGDVGAATSIDMPEEGLE